MIGGRHTRKGSDPVAEGIEQVAEPENSGAVSWRHLPTMLAAVGMVLVVGVYKQQVDDVRERVALLEQRDHADSARLSRIEASLEYLVGRERGQNGQSGRGDHG